MPEASSERIRRRFLAAMNQHRQGNLHEAESAYRALIESAPDHAGSIHNLGLIHFQRGQVDDAIALYRRAIAIAPDYDEAHNNLGVALEGQDRLDEARAAYERALALKPDYATACNNLGDVLRKLERLPEAEAMYRRALALEPGNALAWLNLGNLLWTRERNGEAEEAFREAARLAPRNPHVHHNFGDFLVYQGRMQESEAAYRRALELEPEYAEVYADLGCVLGYQGRSDEAEEAFRRALALDPTLAKVYWYLCSNRKYRSADNEDVSGILALLGSADLEESDAMQLHFALGKIYDDCKEYDKAISHYQYANRIGHKKTAFNPRRFADLVSQIIEVYTPEFFAERRGFGMTSEFPVFIVGMMRSGTTLVEQIVAGHPRVFGAGELNTMREIVDGLAERAPHGETYPQCVTRIDESTAAALAGEYLARSRRDAPADAERISDKMPSNFLHLGLVALLFPEARVIHCRRDPVDTCLSVFFQNFAGINEFAHDLGEIGQYYRQYDRLMTHWREALPLPMIEIQYEDLIAGMDDKARELVAFLDLEWDERCIAFHRNPRAVVTSSAWQVRQPLYTTSVRRWRNYERYLGPLLEQVGIDPDAGRD